jgi:hypothetical protein
MPINFSSLGGTSSGGAIQGSTDFTVKTGSYVHETIVLSRDYAIGSYSIEVSPVDSSVDVYFISSEDLVVGYSNTSQINATGSFKKITIIGSSPNASFSFTYLGEAQEASEVTHPEVDHAHITSVVTSSLPNIDDTTVLNGRSFAANVEVFFIDQSSVETAAKSVVRSSSTQLIVTRPDSFSPDNSPYTIRVHNASLTSPAPSGANLHLLSNSVTAGTNPVWSTGATLIYSATGPTTITLLATDSEASDIDYSIVSGTLPAGFTLDGETGVITGTPSEAVSDGDATSLTKHLA